MDEPEVLRLLSENPSVGAVCQRSGLSAAEVAALKAEAGHAAAWYHDRVVRHLETHRTQIDVTRTFSGSGEASPQGVWTWLAMDPHSRLILSWLVGDRDPETANLFMGEVASRLSKPVKVVVDDGRNAYLETGDSTAVIDEHVLTTLYGPSRESADTNASAPEPRHLDIHLRCRGFSRFTASSAQLIEDHAYGMALSVLTHNFVRIDERFATTPAVMALILDAPWPVGYLADVLRMWRNLKTGPWFERLVVLPKR